MMQLLAKWRVTLQFPKDARGNGLPEMRLYVSDNFMSNVLRKVSEIGFEAEPTFLTIQLASQPTNVCLSVSAAPAPAKGT